MQPVQSLLPKVSSPVVCMVLVVGQHAIFQGGQFDTHINPQPSRKTQCQRRERDAARQREQVVKNRNTRRDQEADDSHGRYAAEPSSPMDKGVGLKMPRLAQDTDENILCADVDIERTTDAKADQAYAVRNLLDHWSYTPERGRCNPLTTVLVDYKTEGEVCGCNKTHAHVDSLRVFLWVLHLGHDWQKSRSTSPGAEDRSSRSNASRKGRASNDVVSEVVVPSLGR